jgi:hypothetical protein
LVWTSAIAAGLVSAAPAQEEPPIAGQPATFNGAVGVFKIAGWAEPTELQAEDPLTYTVRISAVGPFQIPPQRPNLHRQPAFKERFHIDDLPERSPGQSGVWEYAYRLKPLRPDLRSIPVLRFDYYKPGVIPPEKGYRATYTHVIPLTVHPRARVRTPGTEAGQASKSAPDFVYHLGPASAVLQQPKIFSLPPWPLLVLLLLMPPALCAVWYGYWAKQHPAAARLARQRQSQAARNSIQLLHRARASRSASSARQAAGAVTAYLRDRWHWSGVEPTPAEAVRFLHENQVAGPVIGAAETFFAGCAAARFAPSKSAESEDFVTDAERLILSLENQHCSPV